MGIWERVGEQSRKCAQSDAEMLGFAFMLEMARREQSLEPHGERNKKHFNIKIK